MTDTRFTIAFESVIELIDGLDVDDIGDVETLLMVILARPVAIVDDEEDPSSLEVIVGGQDFSTGTIYEFPLSIVELVRSCAETAKEIGPYKGGDADDAQAIPAMNDEELIEILQRGLGQVRLFNLLDGD